MKILLITLPRTGSTSLLKNISEEYNLEVISEPFNSSNDNLEKYKNFDWNNATEICVKTHINHKDISFYSDFVKLFDNDLKKLSNLINLNILYYEDLFDINSEDKLRKNDARRKNLI